MKKIIVLIIAIFISYTVTQANTDKSIHTLIKQQIGVPVELKNQKLNEVVSVQFKVEKGQGIVLDVHTNNPELKDYIIKQFKTMKFDNISENQGITYFVDINFKVL
jgi:hypothetical protein